jgi:hypothetical protein
MTKELTTLRKGIAENINKLNDLAGEIQSQFDNFLENISFKNESVEKFYQGIVKSLDKQDSDADMFWFVKELTNPECPYWDLEVGQKATFSPQDEWRYHYRNDEYIYYVELYIEVDDNNVVTDITFNHY